MDTIIPWASEWLFFYEVWKATAIWMGDDIGAVEKETESVLYRYGGWSSDRQKFQPAGFDYVHKKTS
ncbi:hypothetical protein AB0876_27745 [Mycobacterium sp. NPDC049093]